MTAEIWFGRWPKVQSEQDALIELYNFLQQEEEHFIILTQFAAGPGNEIDFVILKSQAIFVVELKSAHGKLVGGQHGPWKVIQSDGVEVDLHSNPAGQVKNNYRTFKEWCENKMVMNRPDGSKAWPPEYSQGIYSYIVITPTLVDGYKIELPTYIKLTGLDKFYNNLRMRTSDILRLTREEMESIPHLLKLTKYTMATKKISEDWEIEPYTGLVAVGHNASIPVFNLGKLKKDVITIGRNPENDLSVEDETVSKYHARIRHEGAVWIIEDLDSKNGTYLNFKGEAGGQEKCLESGKVNALKHHSVVRFGQVRFMFINEQ